MLGDQVGQAEGFLATRALSAESVLLETRTESSTGHFCMKGTELRNTETLLWAGAETELSLAHYFFPIQGSRV